MINNRLQWLLPWLSGAPLAKSNELLSVTWQQTCRRRRSFEFALKFFFVCLGCVWVDFLLFNVVNHHETPPFGEYFFPTTEQASLSCFFCIFFSVICYVILSPVFFSDHLESYFSRNLLVLSIHRRFAKIKSCWMRSTPWKQQMSFSSRPFSWFTLILLFQKDVSWTLCAFFWKNVSDFLFCLIISQKRSIKLDILYIYHEKATIKCR